MDDLRGLYRKTLEENAWNGGCQDTQAGRQWQTVRIRIAHAAAAATRIAGLIEVSMNIDI
jgi:hypothetical protein